MTLKLRKGRIVVMSETVCYDFEAMKNIDVRTVDRETLVDIRDVMIDTKLPQRERLLDFIRQVKSVHFAEE